MKYYFMELKSYQKISSNTSKGKGWGLNTIKSLSFTGVSEGAFFLHDGSATSVWIWGNCDPELPPNCCWKIRYTRKKKLHNTFIMFLLKPIKIVIVAGQKPTTHNMSLVKGLFLGRDPKFRTKVAFGRHFHAFL